ncbi:MAG: hypothetical protein QGG09_17790 [Pirellulaceae bacterium]|nr:hypothetical protein [Pirellulaceae bacterium]
MRSAPGNLDRDQIFEPIASWRQRASRSPLILLAMVCLILGIWGGLVRLHWTFFPLTTYNVNWVSFHGPLMVCGFLGTLIGVERAVAVGRWWAYLGPVLTSAGGLLLVIGVLGKPAPTLFALGSLWLLGITVTMYAKHRSAFLLVMAAGAAAWLVGNLAWRLHWPFHRVVPWWTGFLLLTIVAERLELSRVLRLGRWQLWFITIAIAAYISGLLIGVPRQMFGERIDGASMIAMAMWLLCFDVAVRTIRRPGRPRFTASCLLSGYVWLAVAGLLLCVYAPLPKYGGAYDATLHAFFLGFLFTMIFGHVPIILPAVLDVPIPFRQSFYIHLILLHLSLLLRITGDLTSLPKLQGWGGILTAATIAIFLLNTIGSTLLFVVRRKQDPPNRKGSTSSHSASSECTN